jgi:hypothetical protein
MYSAKNELVCYGGKKGRRIQINCGEADFFRFLKNFMQIWLLFSFIWIGIYYIIACKKRDDFFLKKQQFLQLEKTLQSDQVFEKMESLLSANSHLISQSQCKKYGYKIFVPLNYRVKQNKDAFAIYYHATRCIQAISILKIEEMRQNPALIDSRLREDALAFLPKLNYEFQMLQWNTLVNQLFILYNYHTEIKNINVDLVQRGRNSFFYAWQKYQSLLYQFVENEFLENDYDEEYFEDDDIDEEESWELYRPYFQEEGKEYEKEINAKFNHRII